MAVKERTTTEYLVLEQRELKDANDQPVMAWVESGTAASTSRTGAVGEVAKEREGVWRPVPSRNWGGAIRTRKETFTRMRVEEVEPF